MNYNWNYNQKYWDESNCTPNKIWVDKGNEFYNRSMKSYRTVFNA